MYSGFLGAKKDAARAEAAAGTGAISKRRDLGHGTGGEYN
jgi:hypothetical protein